MTQAERYAAGERGALLGLCAYLVMAAGKLTVGIWAGSRAMTADGINNVTDVAAAVAVLVGFRVGRQPADAEHRYGHQKAESVAALVVSALMGVVGLEVALDALRAMLAPAGAPPHPLAAMVATVAAVVMAGLAWQSRRLGRRLRSDALAAQASDQLADAWSSTAALVGILGARAGWPWLDPLAGLVVAGFVLRTALRVGAEGAHRLMDGFDLQQLEGIRRQVGRVEGVAAVHDLRARQTGPDVMVDVTIGVNRHLTVAQGHAVAERVEQALQGYMQIAHIMVHVEPERRLR